ncbi:MAG: GNAT family N-acetyltransferase [Pseudomonadota bacterium]
MARYTIRPAKPGEGKALSAIEKSAAALFRGVGMDAIADAPVTPPAVYEQAIAQGRALVAIQTKRPVAFLAYEPIDAATFISEVSVQCDHMGHGLGAQLIDALPWPTTLSCFTQVPWNRAYYERLEFRVVRPLACGPGHAAIARDEALRFDPWPRCIMLRGA